MLNNPNEWHNIEEDLDSNVNGDIADNAVVSPPPNAGFDKSKVKIALVAVGLLLIGAIAIAKFAGSNKTQLAMNDPNVNPMVSGMQDPNAINEPTTVINVDLEGETAQAPAQQLPQDNGAIPISAAPMPTGGQNPAEIVIASKEMTPTDKYNFNKEAIARAANKDTVVVTVGGGGRPNPFFPFKEKKSSGVKYPGNVSFDIIEPPPSVLPDPKATQLMETTISGIMYDTRNPSAIININGEDQLVRKNDKIGGYTILDITKDKVVIKSGTNIYRASVGQSITNEELNFNDIANLNKKFAGAYRPVSRTNINFNAY